MLGFVREQAARTLGTKPEVFAVSARRAREGRQKDDGGLVEASGLPAFESRVTARLDEAERFRLKLLNPDRRRAPRLQPARRRRRPPARAAGRGRRDAARRSRACCARTATGSSRDFRLRLSDVEKVLLEFEKRGNAFFEERLRLGRFRELFDRERLRREFEEAVVGGSAARGGAAGRGGGRLDGRRGPRAVAGGHAPAARAAGRARRAARGRARRPLHLRPAGAARARSARRRSARSRATTPRARRGGWPSGCARRWPARPCCRCRLWGSARSSPCSPAPRPPTSAASWPRARSPRWACWCFPHAAQQARRELAAKVAALREKLVAALTQSFDRERERSAGRVRAAVVPYERFVKAERERLEQARSGLARARRATSTRSPRGPRSSAAERAGFGPPA